MHLLYASGLSAVLGRIRGYTKWSASFFKWSAQRDNVHPHSHLQTISSCLTCIFVIFVSLWSVWGSWSTQEGKHTLRNTERPCVRAKLVTSTLWGDSAEDRTMLTLEWWLGMNLLLFFLQITGNTVRWKIIIIPPSALPSLPLWGQENIVCIGTALWDPVVTATSPDPCPGTDLGDFYSCRQTVWLLLLLLVFF